MSELLRRNGVRASGEGYLEAGLVAARKVLEGLYCG